jgi:hypothetical protein
LIHEALHQWEWGLPEAMVNSLARRMAQFLYKHRVRIIEPDSKRIKKVKSKS